MFAYYLRLALISSAKTPITSALMVCAIAVGIGACMAFVNFSYLLAQDPIPHKSDVLYAVQLDAGSPHAPAGGKPPPQLTYMDASALMRERRAHRQAAMARTRLVVEPQGADARPFEAASRATYADFFTMFDVPFLFGGPWDAQADDRALRVVVLSRATNDRLFGGEDSVGRSCVLNGNEFRVVGVIDEWKPMPKFYDANAGLVSPPAEVFLPFEQMVALRLPLRGNISCWKPFGDGIEAFLASECVWIQFWAELRNDAGNDAERREYLEYLDSYANEQKRVGRFERPLNNRLSDVHQWLADNNDATGTAMLLVGVGVMFLVVCLLNTVGLLLAKFLGKAPEIGLRRALGASKRTLFLQHLVETGCIGALGGALGVALTWLLLRGIDAWFEGIVSDLLVFVGPMVGVAVALAVVAALAAGLYPTWRACNVPAAALLKT